MLNPMFDLDFSTLYQSDGCRQLDDLFCQKLAENTPELAEQLRAARAAPDELDTQGTSELLLRLAPHLDQFIARLFQIETELYQLSERHHRLAPIFSCRRNFVQRHALKLYKADEAKTFDGALLYHDLRAPLSDLDFAKMVNGWLENEEAYHDQLDLAARYAAWAVHRMAHPDSVLFWQPEKIDPLHLVELEEVSLNGAAAFQALCKNRRYRDGFNLTDPGCDLDHALGEVHYCIHCHNQGKDSCSKGFVDRKQGGFVKNSFGVSLTGCPLEEKISEMHVAKAAGSVIGALALAVIDNPMLAGTGHRICNDCMKGCIYQKQSPVNIPEVETRVLKDVLELPFGFEIYSLLTRWNPLNLVRPYPKAASGKTVLVVGLGPSGYTLAHHLLNEGHHVVAIDGAKIEPLAPEISGCDEAGKRTGFDPIKNIADLREDLGARVMAGFGGVAEYGITVRWDKNFLKIIRLLLERRREFAMFGGVRFGGTVTASKAFELGFDHIALCAGAGAPSVLDIENSLAPGVRQASDFLMALQLTGAARPDTVANLQLRLPVVVIGGGLTAIDTATEAMAYYPLQVEKFLNRYEILVADKGEAAVRAAWSPQELKIVDEFLTHGRALRDERARAAKAGEKPNIAGLVDQWGGVVIAYRRRLIDAPSYTLNAEEVDKALQEGIRFAELLVPKKVLLDDVGRAHALQLDQQIIGEDGTIVAGDQVITLDCKSLLVAAGTKPNTVLAREYPDLGLKLDGKFFQAYDDQGQAVHPEKQVKTKDVAIFMHHHSDGRTMSFFGDLHPSFAGNVVKAMAGAKRGYPLVSTHLGGRVAQTTPAAIFAKMNDGLRARVVEVIRLTPTIVELVIKAPMAAKSFQPGQFFRLQTFEAHAPKGMGTTLASEGMALTGAWVDVEKGLVGLIVLEMGGSSSLCQFLKSNEPVILMGPSGSPSEIPSNEVVLLAGGGLGNAVLFSIGRALRLVGSKVLYFAAYKTLKDRYHVEDIEAAADVIVWCSDQAPGFVPNRCQDKTFVGNVVEAMKAYEAGELGPIEISLGEADRVLAIGSDRMMAAVALARHGVLAGKFKTDHLAIGSINSPMQCMMKEICAQCL